jgi:hypothetical protein
MTKDLAQPVAMRKRIEIEETAVSSTHGCMKRIFPPWYSALAALHYRTIYLLSKI